MKTTFAVTLCVLLLLATGCAQKVNDPADVQAISGLSHEWDRAFIARDAAGVASVYTDDVIRMEPNQPALKGKDALQASFQAFLENAKWEGDNIVEDIRVSGDLAVARGTGTYIVTLNELNISRKGTGKWAAAYQRQADGTWKCIYDIWNSDLPVTETVATGEDELALLQIEQQWADAAMKKDAAALDPILAAEYVGHDAENTRNKNQYLARVKSNSVKIESGQLSDMKALVFGDTAVVHGMWTEKSTTSGKDTSGQYRWTDTFVKRDGRWQCVGSYSEKIG